MAWMHGNFVIRSHAHILGHAGLKLSVHIHRASVAPSQLHVLDTPDEPVSRGGDGPLRMSGIFELIMTGIEYQDKVSANEIAEPSNIPVVKTATTNDVGPGIESKKLVYIRSTLNRFFFLFSFLLADFPHLFDMEESPNIAGGLIIKARIAEASLAYADNAYNSA